MNFRYIGKIIPQSESLQTTIVIAEGINVLGGGDVVLEIMQNFVNHLEGTGPFQPATGASRKLLVTDIDDPDNQHTPDNFIDGDLTCVIIFEKIEDPKTQVMVHFDIDDPVSGWTVYGTFADQANNAVKTSAGGSGYWILDDYSPIVLKIRSEGRYV